MRWPSHRKVAVTLIAIGLIPLLHSLYLGPSDNFEVLRIPVRLTPGQFESPEFKTDLNGTYLLELDFDRMKNPLNMDCRIGIPVFPRDCAGIRQTINFYWKVVSREKGITAQGTYKVLAYGGDGVIFGQFQGRRGARERVLLDIEQDAGELNAANPRLTVQARDENREGYAISFGYSVLWAMCVGGLGVTMLLFPILLGFLYPISPYWLTFCFLSHERCGSRLNPTINVKQQPTIRQLESRGLIAPYFITPEHGQGEGQMLS